LQIIDAASPKHRLMEPITIQCLNRASVPRYDEPISLGVPLPQGVSHNPDYFTLKDAAGLSVPLQVKVLNYWPDRSIKWLLCDFLASVGVENQCHYTLEHVPASVAPQIGCTVEKTGKIWSVATGAVVFEVEEENPQGFLSVFLSDGNTPVCRNGVVRLIDATGQPWALQIEQGILESTGPVRTTLELRGYLVAPDRRRLNFSTRLNFYLGSSRTSLELRLHNPDAAKHPGNLWDLGDPSSMFFKEWTLDLPVVQNITTCRLHPSANINAQVLELAGGSIYQEASGGENWNSPVHRNRDGVVPMQQPGWVLRNGNQEITGNRAQPTLQVETKATLISAGVDNFWQRFPKELGISQSVIRFGLLPARFPAGHELQGGEQITERIWIDFAVEGNLGYIAGPGLVAVCNKQHYRDVNVFPERLWEPKDSRYLQLLTLARGTKGFQAKRERLDEYGWRNFGDLYADHETAFHQEESIFVSHYNNQYDPLYSFFRLFLSTKDVGWVELASDLAAHVADIDINHTDQDREEYCHGLFWHTDHYLDAGLSTHRMASREHLQKKNPAFCGGGPAAEHCYSSGLMLHYLMTGTPSSRQLVLQLADWCLLSLQGPQTLGAAALRAIKNFKRLHHNMQTIWPRFPLNRATGNCLTTTIDAFELTGESRYLVRAARLIQDTVHPADNPDDRNLLDAESSWSYTVFFVALCRYLSVKRLWNQHDGDFTHARESLLTYARWMVENEYLYLEKPEILEFPNETWAGQDLRKGVVLYYASQYASVDEAERFLAKARYLLDNGLDELCRQETSYFTRPLALMMQNGWAIEALNSDIRPKDYPGLPQPAGRPTPQMTIVNFIKRTVADIVVVIPNTSFKREWRWLKTRLGNR